MWDHSPGCLISNVLCLHFNDCVAWFLYEVSSSGAVSEKSEKKNSVSQVFSFKVQVRLDSQSREDERLKDIHKMPSARSVTCLRKFSLLLLVWLCEILFSFLLLFSLSSLYMSLCFSVFSSAVLWVLMITFPFLSLLFFFFSHLCSDLLKKPLK